MVSTETVASAMGARFATSLGTTLASLLASSRSFFASSSSILQIVCYIDWDGREEEIETWVAGEGVSMRQNCLIFLRFTNKSVKLMTANSQRAPKQETKQRMMYMSRAVA